MNHKIITAMALMLAATAGASAQSFDPTINLDVEARFDYQYDVTDGTTNDANSGFKGRYLNLALSGDLNKHLKYAWRQRLNKSAYDSNFFDATDWINLTYMPNDNWAVSGGKEVVAIGGFEYDRAPINIYKGSEFWNNIPCYQFGVSGEYITNPGNNKLMLQICTNPFYKVTGNSNTYAYNFMWIGDFSHFHTLYSLNMIEYTKGHYINYIALGHKFDAGRVSIELDLMNRASSHQTFLFKDASIMGRVAVDLGKGLKLLAKSTYDVNTTHSNADYTVMPGTEITSVGGGLEYHPFKIKNQDVRLHACYFYSWGKNGNTAGTLMDKNSLVDLGVTWSMNILKARK